MSDTQGATGVAGDVEVSIIVVTHGARGMTLACLGSFAGMTDRPRSEVIVVDNASPDGLADEIASLYPQIRVVSQVANLGFAAAANLGADLAKGRYLLFLNPDTLANGDTLFALVAFARTMPCPGPLGVRTYFPSGEPDPACCRRDVTLWRLLCAGLGLDTRFAQSDIFRGMGYARLSETGACAVDVVCGVCLLVERSVWDRLGGFSPAFFMYGEDDDFSRRARRLGCQPTLALDLAIVHHGSGTEPDQVRKLCQILAARSLIVRAGFARPVRPVGLALLMLRPLLGKYFGRREFRPLWQNVWIRRRQWLSGRFA